jgi:hypothetical protein
VCGRGGVAERGWRVRVRAAAGTADWWIGSSDYSRSDYYVGSTAGMCRPAGWERVSCVRVRMAG